MRISVLRSRELQGVILALKGMDRTLAAQVRKHTRAMIEKEWRGSLAQHTITRMENRVLVDTARASVTNQNVTLKAGTLSKKLSGGAKAYEVASLVEFGTDPKRTTRATSRTGKQYRREFGSRFRPRNRKGYVAYQAAADDIPRLASLWVQTVVRTFLEAIEEGSSRGA